MALRISPGLAASWMKSYGFKPLMDYGVIEVYTGAQPDTAAHSPNGSKLARITTDGLPWTAGSPLGGLVVNVSPVGGVYREGDWRLIGSATGTAGWWRWKWNGIVRDGDEFSELLPRVDGLVGESLFLQTTSITPSTDLPIDSFSLRFS